MSFFKCGDHAWMQYSKCGLMYIGLVESFLSITLKCLFTMPRTDWADCALHSANGISINEYFRHMECPSQHSMILFFLVDSNLLSPSSQSSSLVVCITLHLSRLNFISDFFTEPPSVVGIASAGTLQLSVCLRDCSLVVC